MAIFSGAGLSGAAPACLPMGNRLRDALLTFMHARAAEVSRGLVTQADLAALTGSQRKLEVVLARLEGVTNGDDALHCLECLRLPVPNEAHMLAALHLACGGTHVTVNFDLGIETAYALLRGEADLPTDAPESLMQCLPAWRSAAGDMPPLKVVASQRGFERWRADDRPPGLLKVHGSLGPDGGRRLVDVVVSDFVELGALSPGRRTAVDVLGDADGLVVVGYSGADPDVYAPLLETAARTSTKWLAKWLADDSPVWEDAAKRSIEVRTGDPDGLVVPALRRIVGHTDHLRWPEISVGPGTWHDAFRAWAEWFQDRQDPYDIAVAWAWLWADGGELDRAEQLLSRLADDHGTERVLLRLAEVLYTRAEAGDRDRAEQLYRRLSRSSRVELGTRAHAVLRIGGIARGRAVRRGGLRAAPDIVRALSAGTAVLLRHRHRDDSETTASAYGELGHVLLRSVELGALTAPRRVWPFIASVTVPAAALNQRCADMTANGNRKALATSHRLLALALRYLLLQRTPPHGLETQLSDLRDRYRYAEDYPGAGNCEAALAVIAMTHHDHAAARRSLASAHDFYCEGRSGPIASGAALLDRLDGLLKRATDASTA